jgi:uncharacterized protein YdhG (YjbR/CyaY superfamily)
VQSDLKTVDEYMKTLPVDRLDALIKIRRICISSLSGYIEEMKYGMPGYLKQGVVEVSFNSQKNYISVYILKKAVLDKYRGQLKDIGKGCIRYKKLIESDYILLERIFKDVAQSLEKPCV